MTDTDSIVIRCAGCNVKNRIQRSRLSERPKCGRCGSYLTSSGHSGTERPVTARYGSTQGDTGSYADLSARRLRTYSTGDRIGDRYQIMDIFGGEGRSSMGVVYMCHDLEHNQTLALKTLQDRCLDSKKTVDSFKKEALAWIHLGEHPYIVRAYWVREIDERMYIACEYVEPDAAGMNSLTQHLREPLDLRQTLYWSIQFCHGMEYACSMGVTPHRDIKPDNIMVSDRGDIKITDFGLVGLLGKAEHADGIRDAMDRNNSHLTFLSAQNSRIIAGSPPWMSPEQFYGVAEMRSDMYSFGIVLYQMANRGALPFEPRKGDTWRNAHKLYPVPSVSGPWSPLSGIINTCLQKRRDRRFENFGVLRTELEKIFRKEVSRRTGEKPPMPEVTKDISESRLINKGMSLANLGLIDEGIKNYRESIRRNPNNAEAHYNLANALAKKGLNRSAVGSYRDALRLDRNFTAAHFNLGIALFNDGRTDEAITEYRNLLRLRPDFAAAYYNLGMAYQKEGLREQALASYREASRKDPAHAEAHFRAGNLLLAGNELERSIESFSAALHANPSYAEAANNLGSAYMKKGLLDDAISSYARAIQIRPDNADAHYNLGLAFIRKDMKREAYYAFEEFRKSAGNGDPRIAKAEEASGKLRRFI